MVEPVWDSGLKEWERGLEKSNVEFQAYTKGRDQIHLEFPWRIRKNLPKKSKVNVRKQLELKKQQARMQK